MELSRLTTGMIGEAHREVLTLIISLMHLFYVFIHHLLLC